MFGRFKSMFKVSEAGNIVKEALRATSVGAPGFDVDALAIRLVSMVYASKPDLFDGKIGQRPHAVATAAAALAQGLKTRPEGFSEAVDHSMFLALGSILLSVSTHSQKYGLGGYDVPMLKVAEQAYFEHEQRTREATDKVLGSLGS